jgi:hypothetical protein
MWQQPNRTKTQIASTDRGWKPILKLLEVSLSFLRSSMII